MEVRDTALNRKTATIMVATVAGYGRLVAEDGGATLQQFTGCRAVFQSGADQHGGRVLDAADGSVRVEFVNAVDGLRCALHVQSMLRIRNASLERGRQMRFRIGIATGDGVADRGMAGVSSLELATRLADLALAEGICIPRAVQQRVAGQVPALFKDIGEQIVANAQPVHVYAVEPVRLAQGVKTVAPRPHPKVESSKPAALVWMSLGLVATIVFLLSRLFIAEPVPIARAPDAAAPSDEVRAPAVVPDNTQAKLPLGDRTASPSFPDPAAKDGAADALKDARLPDRPAADPPVTDQNATPLGQQADPGVPPRTNEALATPGEPSAPQDAAPRKPLDCLRYIPEARMSVWVPCASAALPSGEPAIAPPAPQPLGESPPTPSPRKEPAPFSPRPRTTEVAPPPPAPANEERPKATAEPKRRPQRCADIIERGQLGELSREDRLFLQTQCR